MADENMFSDWCRTSLGELLGFPIGNEITDYLTSLENQREIKEYLGSLLDINDKKTKIFIQEFFNRWRPSAVNSHVYKKNNPMEKILKQDSQKKQSAGSKQRDVVAKVNEATALEEDDKPTRISVDVTGAEFLDKNKPMENELPTQRQSSSPFKKKNLKFVPLYSADGKVKTNVAMLPGRRACQCLAQKHKLINNCCECGRIVCAQEGSGPCMFCGYLVCSPEDSEIIARESKQGRKLRDKLLQQLVPDDVVEESGDKLQKAIDHKNRLLEYDKNCTKRTKVIDDEADYFASDNRWLTKKQRAAVTKRDDAVRDKRFASRLDRKFTIDFAGRAVVENEDQAFAYTEEDTATPIQSLSQNDDMVVDVHAIGQFPLIDPRLSINPPEFQSSSPSSSHNRENNVTSHLREQENAVRNMLRNQDRELQEMVDQGMCMSMHQPWASLLVHGVKRLEGRSWYTAHRGRLWIASTAQPSDQNTIDYVEGQYRESYRDKNEKVQFPKDYPSSVLLGCVNVVDCASNEEYFKKNPHCKEENDSAYLFVCEDAQQLRMKFQMKGKHKIYKLEPHIHLAAKKNFLNT